MDVFSMIVKIVTDTANAVLAIAKAVPEIKKAVLAIAKAVRAFCSRKKK